VLVPPAAQIVIPLSFHVRRLCFSAVFYGALVFVLVFGVVQLQKAAFPGFLPVHWVLSDSMAELPIDLLIFHFAVPYTLDYFRPREVRRAAAAPIRPRTP